VSGVFTIKALGSIARADQSFNAVYDAAVEAWEGLSEEDRERVHGVEVAENRVVGIYFVPQYR
jgi:hypothetical protein